MTATTHPSTVRFWQIIAGGAFKNANYGYNGGAVEGSMLSC